MILLALAHAIAARACTMVFIATIAAQESSARPSSDRKASPVARQSPREARQRSRIVVSQLAEHRVLLADRPARNPLAVELSIRPVRVAGFLRT